MYLSTRVFWGSLMSPMETAQSQLSDLLNQTSQPRSAPLQRSPQSNQRTMTQRAPAKQKRSQQDRAAACPQWRMPLVGQPQSLLWKIPTTLTGTLAPSFLQRSFLWMSSTGFTISASKCSWVRDPATSSLPVVTAWIWNEWPYIKTVYKQTAIYLDRANGR